MTKVGDRVTDADDRVWMVAGIGDPWIGRPIGVDVPVILKCVQDGVDLEMAWLSQIGDEPGMPYKPLMVTC